MSAVSLGQNVGSHTVKLTDERDVHEIAPLLDRSHLARQTYGVRELEGEVLELFARQVRRLLGDLFVDGSDTVLVAHTLLGSAKGVGAFAIADAALAVERRAIAGKRDSELIRRLCEVAEQTLREIYQNDAAASDL